MLAASYDILSFSDTVPQCGGFLAVDVAACGLTSFLWPSNTPWCVRATPLSAPVSGQLGFSHVLSLVDSAAVSLGHMCHFEFWFSLDIRPGTGLLGHMVVPDIFSHPVGCLFFLLMVSFVVQRLLCFSRCHLSLLGGESKKMLLLFIAETVLPMFSTNS